MPQLTYSGKLPEPEEFRRELEEAMAKANPLDDLLLLSQRLQKFEQQYGMSSEDFLPQYESGVLDDEIDDYFEWMVTYSLFAKTKRLLEATLMRAAVYFEMAETA